MNTNKDRILVVEDEVLNAKFLTMQLNKNGFNAYKSVESGEEAILGAISERPEIIIMDIRLGGKIDGIQAAEEILKEYDAKIIYLTGYIDKELRERADKTNHKAYLIKPVNIKELISTLTLVTRETA